jgi:hypothetical protein
LQPFNGNNEPALGAAGQAAAGGASVAMGIDLPGSPQYYRFIRLTNAQWAQSVQDIFQLPTPSGLEAGFESPVAGSTDCAPTAGR